MKPTSLQRDLAVAVLAGGRSQRFGSDKALYQLGEAGPTVLECVLMAGRALTGRLVIVGTRRFEYLAPEIPMFEDDEPGCGPLGGIATALRVAERERVLVVGCDMPCLNLALLRWMLALDTEADVVIPRTSDGRLQTMHAIYQVTALPRVEEALVSGERAVARFLDSVSRREISETEARSLDPHLNSFFSLNRPGDIERALHCFERK